MRKGTRVLGPYRDKERNDWRVVLIEPSEGEERGARSSQRFAREEEAHQWIAKLEEELKLEGPITVEVALKEYEEYKRAKGNKAGTIATTRDRLESMCAVHGERKLSRIAELPARAGDIYAALASRVSVDTHRNALGEARTFGKWCVKRGYLRRNPWAEVEAVGARSAGKLQLRVDEARRWLAKAVELAEGGDEGAVAAMMTLLMGLRASEVVDRVGRDVDDGGALLWIDRAKTKSGRRVVEVPAVLRDHLARRARRDALASEALFPHDRHWVRASVKRICRLAGVPEVGAHAMRGAHASLAMQAGASSHLVAASLGHASPAVTLKHYAEPGAVADGRNKRALQVLAGGKR